MLVAKTILKSFSVWRRQVKNWRVVSVRSLFTRFFQRLVLAYQNIYIRELGADPIQLGIVNSFSPIADTVFSIPIGWLQDRYSLKKIFLAGVALQLIVRVIFAFATGWVMLIPAMLLQPIATKAAVCITICLVTLKREDRSICRGICDGFFATPSLFAPTVAALVITFFGGISAEGIRPLYFIQLFADFFLFLFLIAQLTEIARVKVIKKKSSFVGDLREVFERGTSLKKFLAFSAVGTFTLTMMTTFKYPFAHEIKGANQLIIGGMTTAGFLIQSLLSIPMANLVTRTGWKKMVYILEPLYWLSILILVIAPSPEYLIISSIFDGFRNIAGFICITPLMAELVPIDCLGRWRGIIGMVGALVSIPAPIIGGLVWETIGPHYLFLIVMLIDMFIRIPILTKIPEIEIDKYQVPEDDTRDG